MRQHTAQVWRVQNLLGRTTAVRFGAQRLVELTPSARATMLPHAAHVVAVTSRLAVFPCLGPQMKTLAKAVQQRLQPPPAYAQLQTVDGIGPILAQTSVLATGAMRRFPPVGHSAADGRCGGSTQISNGKRQGQGHVNQGHPSLEWASREAAQCASRCSPTGQRLYQRQQAKSPLMSARQAVAPKWARAGYDSRRALVAFEVHNALG